MKKEIDIDSRLEILNKIHRAYKDYEQIIFDISRDAVLYFSKENNCVAWCWDMNTFLDFLNMDVIDTNYYIYKFEIVNGHLVTKKA